MDDECPCDCTALPAEAGVPVQGLRLIHPPPPAGHCPVGKRALDLLISATVKSRSPSPARLRAWLLGVPVFVKVMGIALGVALLLGLGMLWQIHRTWHAHLYQELDHRGQKQAREVGAHLAALADEGLTVEVSEELRHSLRESVDTAYLVLEDSNGVVQAEARDPNLVAHTNQLRELTARIGAEQNLLRVGISTARVDKNVSWLTRRLGATTTLIAMLGLAAAWWLSRILAHPIEELAHHTRAVKAGQYHGRVPVHANDEVGELAVACNELTRALAEKEAIRRQLLRRVIYAGEEERKRIARELHDQTGQALTSLIASLSALEARQEPSMRQPLVDLRRQIEQTLEEVHELSVALRPSVLDDIGLMAALQRHCRLFAGRSGIQVECAGAGHEDDGRLPAEVELTIYRMVQEALTNAVRHGEATEVKVRVQRDAAGVTTTIRDNGSGFDARDWQKRCGTAGRLGLLGLEERVALLGGRFSVESSTGQGSRICAEIPIQPSS